MKKKITIEGMSCMHCVKHVREALEELGKKETVEVNLEGQYALVETEASDQTIIEAIDIAGYDVIKVEEV
ncbi:MAG: heavy-metal-associated domain-containing protein [Cellulosilyticaceae bacterium]